MKVGILTFTEGYNYGNKLQNYALLTYLQNNFPCEVKTVDNCVAQGSRFEKARILLTWAFPSAKHYMYWKRLLRFKSFNKKYLKFTSEKLTSNTKKFSEVDCFVCGSDQIWNPHYYSNIDLLTGKLPVPKRSISYAASFGVNEIPDEKKVAFAKALGNLDAISVREEQGLHICKELGFENGRVNIDPTFLLSKDEWLKVIRKPDKQLPSKYVVTYFLGSIKNNVEYNIENYCKINNLERIDLNSVTALKWFDITPFEFLYLIKNAEFVFTDSFHASVFSIIFGKNFLTAERTSKNSNKMSSRIDTLFSTFSCENHRMIAFDGNIDSLKMDEAKVESIIQHEKDRTYEYFSSIIFH
ncbi:polysaccharide pyruvyl transferase family protein [Novisyntrophococcus fermenticellae]|uniref:polysaccharide pyruvyl transferase family protein n=1 Tax=Novisyntrophococcus fermenticellae TaxID=2068655 RepID=UPI001E5EC2FC|nr:polysaccharide pyruvyl transferase family protein [Novisyntrophococcus fermenticellae]